MKNVVANIVQTPDGTILWSRYTHDYVTYQDANGEFYMIDGGPSIFSRASVNKVSFKSLRVFDTDPWEKQRQVILRGTFDAKGWRVWVPLAKLSNEHVKNLIKDYPDHPFYNIEFEYREENNIQIEEHDYASEHVKNTYKKEEFNFFEL
jgi:hypothetical protein